MLPVLLSHSYFVEAVAWGVERYTREIGYLTWTRIILTPTVYLLHPVIMLGIMDMAEFLKGKKFLFYLPIILSAPLLYTSQWTHSIYWFDEKNLYIAADNIMCYYPYFLFFFYVVMFLYCLPSGILNTAHGKTFLVTMFFEEDKGMREAQLCVSLDKKRYK